MGRKQTIVTENDALRNLARLFGVSATYVDVWDERRGVSSETLLHILQHLGAPVADFGDVQDALRLRRQSLCREIMPPVVAAWKGSPAAVRIRLPRDMNGARWHLHIAWENGGREESCGAVGDLHISSCREVEGVRYATRYLELPANMPCGYHRLVLEIDGRRSECMLIVAPRRVYANAAREQERLWGVFLPLYSLQRQSSRGAGDFSDLEALMRWTAAQGGSLVATLPLLATLWEQTGDPSPYNPASRLFWNEFFLDPRQIVEFENCDAAKALADVLGKQHNSASAGGLARLVDYEALMRSKRQVLESLAASFFAGGSARRDELVRHCRENPELELFARFRAVGERQGKPWPEWPQSLRGGTIMPHDYDEAVYRYHLYAQWQVERQLAVMTERADSLGLLWYLDFPLGTSGEGYDVWREPELFVRQATAGAPPDAFFTKGQNWGFPPLNPDALRRQEYRYLIKALRNHLQHARILRLDHVMWLYRFYWIPQGHAADDGAYVHYPLNELFAILTLESHRHRARIVGENLGTVPPRVDEALDRHGVGGMYVLQYETNPDKQSALRPVPAASVAGVNTHDMPQFAAYWQGLDIEDRVDLGLLTPEEAAVERRRREKLRNDLSEFLRKEKLLEAAGEPQVLDVLEACLAYLARSPAGVVLVNLEDLWAETASQNVPGTYHERPNWRRLARYPLDAFSTMPSVLRILEKINRLRRSTNPETVREERKHYP